MDFILVNFRYRESEGWQWKSFYVVQRNKDCNVHDAAATEWKLGHAQKNPNDDSKGLVYLCCKENYSISSSSLSSFRWHLCNLDKELIVRKRVM
jgi:hypothetical protein